MRLIFDTETTGLLQPDNAALDTQPRIIEYGIVILDENYNRVSEHSGVVNPGFPISAEITKITGLVDADLKDAPSFASLVPFFREVFHSCKIWYAHNLPFDRGMLVNELRRLGLEFAFPYPSDQRCTASISEELYGKRMRMIHMYEKVLGRPLAQTHRALDDANALTEIIQELKI